MDNYSSSAKSLILAAIIIEIVFMIIGILSVGVFAIPSVSPSGDFTSYSYLSIGFVIN